MSKFNWLSLEGRIKRGLEARDEKTRAIVLEFCFRTISTFDIHGDPKTHEPARYWRDMQDLLEALRRDLP